MSQFLKTRCAYVCCPLQCSSVLGLTSPSCTAATAVNGLNVEPAAYGQAMARLNAGLRPLVRSHLRWPRTDFVCRLVNQFGLKFGYEAIATIAPVCTSIATSAPESAS